MKRGQKTFAYATESDYEDTYVDFQKENDVSEADLFQNQDLGEKTAVDLVNDIASLNKFNSEIIYSQIYEPIAFVNNVPYQGTFSSQTVFWYTKPLPKIHELPARGGYVYPDPVTEPKISFHRFFFLKLNSGNVLRFAIFGTTTIKETLTIGQAISPKQIEAFMNEKDAPFCIAGVDSIDLAGTKGVNLDIPDKSRPNMSMNDVLRKLNYAALTTVKMTSLQQYDFMVSLLEAEPAIAGWLTDEIQTNVQTFNSSNKAQDASKQAKNAVVTKNNDEFNTKIVGYDALATLAQQLRDREQNQQFKGDKPLIKEDEEVLNIKYKGKDISVAQLKEMFFTTVENSVLDPKGSQITNVLVYQIEGGYFAREKLSAAQARQNWKIIDNVAKPSDLSNWNVKDKFGLSIDGTFALLDVVGTYQTHKINVDYYNGRSFFTKNKEKLNQSFGNDLNDGLNEGYAELITSGLEGEAMRLYIRGEMDRPSEDAVYFRSILNTKGTTDLFAWSFQYELGESIYNDVKQHAIDYAYEKIATVGNFLGTLGNSREALEAQLLGLSLLDYPERTDIITTFGYEDDAVENLNALFADRYKTAELVLGIQVNGYTMEGIITRIQETAGKMNDFANDILTGTVDAIAIEGEFGDDVRRHAYRKMGFKRLNPNRFPYHDDATDSYTTQTTGQFTNTAEQLFAFYVHKVERWKQIITIILVVIVVVLLALVSAGVGLYAAGFIGATGWGSVATVGIVGGLTFTILSESLAQIMGSGILNRDKDFFGFDELLIETLFNIVTFTAFGAVGKVIGTAPTLLRLSVMGGLFFGYSVAHFRYEKGRMPAGDEWFVLVVENILALVLFEVGAYLARGAFLRLQSSGSNAYGKRMSTKFMQLQAEMEVSQKKIAQLSTLENPDKGYQRKITDTYIEQLKVLDEILKTYEKKSSEGWTMKDEFEKELTKEATKSKRATISKMIEQLETAKFIDKTGINRIIGSDKTLTYKGTKESAQLIKKKHNEQGDTVKGPDKNGIITIETKTGEKLLYLPESAENTAGLQKELLSNKELSGKLRNATGDVMAVDAEQIPTLKELFKAGSWNKLSDNLYYGKLIRNGKELKVVFVTEESLYIANDALKAEAANPGSGLGLIKVSLRGKNAQAGFDDYLKNEWKNSSDGEIVQEVWKLEQKAKAEGKHLNDVFEERNLAKIILKTKIETNLSLIETRLRNIEGIEHVYKIDANGNEKGPIIGSQDKADFMELGPFENGDIITHNHPTGSTFSLEDISNLQLDFTEIRAVTKTKIYSLRKTGEFNYYEWRIKYDILQKEFVSKYREQFKNGLSYEQKIEIQEELFKESFKDFNIIYTIVR